MKNCSSVLTVNTSQYSVEVWFLDLDLDLVEKTVVEIK